MSKILKFFTTISIILFLAVIVIVYAFVPDPCGLLFSDNGSILYSLPINTFFYSSLFIFMIIQILLMVFDKIFLSGSKQTNSVKLETWFQGMRLSINLFIILLLIFIGLANNAVDYSYSSIHLIIYFASLIIVIWFLTLPFFIFHTKK
jgi:hypothetical protein